METLQNFNFKESFGAVSNAQQIAYNNNLASAIIWTFIIVGGTAVIIFIVQQQIVSRQIELLKKERCRMIL